MESTLSPELDSPEHVVLWVFDYLPRRGGTTTQTRLHAVELIRLGYKVTVLTQKHRGSLRSEVIEGVNVRRLGLTRHGRIAKLSNLLAGFVWLVTNREHVAAINVMLDSDLAITAKMSRVCRGITMTWVTRGDAQQQLSGLAGMVRRRLIRGVQHIVLTPSMSTELRVHKIYGAITIPVPVDLDAFFVPRDEERRRAAAELSLGTDDIILYVGHLEPRKAADLLLKAFGRVASVYPKLKLVIVGDSPRQEYDRYAASLRQFVFDNRLESKVLFYGSRPDVNTFMRAARIFCLPSHREGMPNVLLEAMASGLVCVAPASAGGDELLAPDRGIVAESNEPDALVRAINTALAAPGECQVMALRASRYIRSVCSPSAVLSQYVIAWRWAGWTGQARDGF